jgi:beta-fructofuranosidase
MYSYHRMRSIGVVAILGTLFLPAGVWGQAPTIRVPREKSAATTRTLDRGIFRSTGTPGWSIETDIESPTISSGVSLLRVMNENNQTWLEARVDGVTGAEHIDFLLKTDYRSEPLVVGAPLTALARLKKHSFLLRYEGYRLDLFYDGVLVDQEWPTGTVQTGEDPRLEFSSLVAQVSIWNSALADSTIISLNDGAEKVARDADLLLGPEPLNVQYSRPRGYNTNAGDAMPFYHDGTFHLFFLLDRRQHHSKWGLGAHQWAHISSTDLVHWTYYPIALPIEHEWEGSICTGSVIFNAGRYYAHYATRMPDRSERLGVAESEDGVHFRKTLPTPFAEPSAPFIHGPNRDPFVFKDGDKFHMLVTAAIADGGAGKSEGALEHLVSDDLSQWAVAGEPFLRSGSQAQPECSDLFRWGDWYYLLFSLNGTTYYRMSKSALGPWSTPESQILDGPEAKVMKAAEFKGGRRLLVGFVQHDNRYGGDLVFRELLQEKDGSLGTTVPKEMEFATEAPQRAADIRLNSSRLSGPAIPIGGDARITANAAGNGRSSFAISIGSGETEGVEEKLIFDSAAGTVSWTDSTGKPATAKLEHVTDLVGPISIVLVLRNTLADLSINGHRTLIHRLSSPRPQRISFSSMGGTVDLSEITVSLLR